MVSRRRGVQAHFMVTTDAEAVNRGCTHCTTSVLSATRTPQPHGDLSPLLCGSIFSGQVTWGNCCTVGVFVVRARIKPGCRRNGGVHDVQCEGISVELHVLHSKKKKRKKNTCHLRYRLEQRVELDAVQVCMV
jgi:hypothetical protein